MSRKQNHELVTNKNGSVSLRHLPSGELMHSYIGPKDEATLLYIEQSELAFKLSTGTSPLVLHDIGLGAGSNALAAIQCFKKIESPRPLHIYSFENDLSGIELAIANTDKLPFFENEKELVSELVAKRIVEAKNFKWVLHEGNYLDHLSKTEKPEIIFFDFYSPKTNPELWNIEMFKKVFEHTIESTTLYTYSASTKVRAAMLAAGFFVGFGRSTGSKSDTTIAARRLSDLKTPLDGRWLERFKASGDPLPHDLSPAEQEKIKNQILNHPQF